jgi:hypothetical protein
MRFLRFAVALTLALAVGGCHSAYIAATISNRTQRPITLIELDYPSASFGTQTLTPGQDFHYRFKVIGSGPTALLYTDAENHDHKSGGPSLSDGDEGRLSVIVTQTGPAWSLNLTHGPDATHP